MSFFLFPKIILEVFLSFFIYHTEFTLHLDLREDMSMSILKANTQKCSCPPLKKMSWGRNIYYKKKLLEKWWWWMQNLNWKLDTKYILSPLASQGFHSLDCTLYLWSSFWEQINCVLFAKNGKTVGQSLSFCRWTADCLQVIHVNFKTGLCCPQVAGKKIHLYCFKLDTYSQPCYTYV